MRAESGNVQAAKAFRGQASKLHLANRKHTTTNGKTEKLFGKCHKPCAGQRSLDTNSDCRMSDDADVAANADADVVYFCVYLPLNLLFQQTPEDQRGAEENVTALDEDQVPDTQHTRHGKAGAEHGEKPLHGEDIGQRRLVGILHGSL